MVREDKLSHKEFESLVAKAMASIPENFRDFLENVAVLIEDEPP
jgi:predicted Zn-dependent protease with MMP-like domain